MVRGSVQLDSIMSLPAPPPLPPVLESPTKPISIRTVCKVNTKLPADVQPTPVHNRWHPDVPSVASVKQGEVFKVECIDWTGGQILNNDDASDIRDVDLSRVHYLSGPIDVEDAQPGDLMVVQICDIAALPGEEWGFTGVFAKENGGKNRTHIPNIYQHIFQPVIHLYNCKVVFWTVIIPKLPKLSGISKGSTQVLDTYLMCALLDSFILV